MKLLSILILSGIHSAFVLASQINVDIDLERVSIEKQDQGNLEKWQYLLEVENDSFHDMGDLVIQYRYYLYRSLDQNNQPESKLDHIDGVKSTFKIEKRSKKMLNIGVGDLYTNGKTKVDDHILKGIKVRIWQNGKLLGEFKDKNKLTKNEVWEVVEPKSAQETDGKEDTNPAAHRLPEERVHKEAPVIATKFKLSAKGVEFANLTLGMAVKDVYGNLKTTKKTLKRRSRSLFGYNFYALVEHYPGCVFLFGKDRKLAAVLINNSDLVDLPEPLKLGESSLKQVHSVLKLTKSVHEQWSYAHDIENSRVYFVENEGKVEALVWALK